MRRTSSGSRLRRAAPISRMIGNDKFHCTVNPGEVFFPGIRLDFLRCNRVAGTDRFKGIPIAVSRYSFVAMPALFLYND